MRHETEFKTFLTTEKLSARTQRPFSAKVASDTVSRCKTVERLLGVELSGRTMGSDAAAQKLCAQIKDGRVSSSEARPYAHNELILAVRTYREFLALHEAK
ncbi:hypothetical protein [Ramlibacter sp. 2FC]|uniref:hypothetical protein n=1 Tax=Ramlibacter sp. 2FC TaxID=2502188 RepID=UPI0010F78AAC|nr:hypothetical protein [Ramlibacter sp. 2FC]